jgi:transposase
VVNGGVCGREKVDIDVSQLRRLGIDEIALRKGHKDFVVVLSDLDTHALIGMAPARTHAAIEAVLLAWGGEVLSNIEEVSIDLSGNYSGMQVA